MDAIIFGLIIILLLIMIPFVPQLLRLRIRIHRFLRLNWFADFQERHFDGLVIFIRIMMVVGILVAGYFVIFSKSVN